ncbi:laccase, multicopper oxidase, benzenediol:oxygen oxidorectuctase, partial [Actinomortierella ambigua]
MPPSHLALSTFILLIINVTTALGSTVDDLVIYNREIAPDGITKSASLVDGKLPGPLISGNKGDTFELEVNNFLDDPSLNLDVSMSWHGIFQQNTNFADGVPGVTQCPIVQDNEFSYIFNATNQAGTFMYHGYSVGSPNDGTAGPLVIYDPNDPHALLYDIDNAKTTIVLSDNYHNSTKALMATYLSGEGNGKAPQPDDGLINGSGWYEGAPTAKLAMINVALGRRYRLRLVNTGISTPFFFSIDDHYLMVIEVDGVSVQPIFVDSLRIDVGQRYSVVLSAYGTRDNYFMRAVMDTTCFPDPSMVYPLVQGIIHYGSQHFIPEEIAVLLAPVPKLPLKQTDLHPLIPVLTPGQPRAGGTDFRAVLNLAFDNTTFRWTVNGKSWKPDANATLLQVLNGQTTFPNQTVIQLPAAGKSVELEIN